MIQMKQEMVESKTEKKEHLEAPLYSPPSGWEPTYHYSSMLLM
jgi:hypothetical protein